MPKSIRKFLFNILGISKVAKLLISVHNIVRPMYDGVSYVLDQLQSGKITEILIAYVAEIKAAIESALDVIKNVADFFEIELPDDKVTLKPEYSVEAKLLTEKQNEVIATTMAKMYEARVEAHKLIKNSSK